jgi:MoxR-like ATPase
MSTQDSIRDMIARLHAQLDSVILGKSDVLRDLLVAIFAGGHILLEDRPGVGKTTLAKALSRSLSVGLKRVQFTPDLMPTDILGSSVYNPMDGSFSFKEGPIFTNIVLADEINRASPRTQSALLEAMSERQVSIEGTTRILSEPFLVIATQNPSEFHGTYPLPEAQLDRFAVRLEIGYPTKELEVDMLFSQHHHHPLEDLEPIADGPAVTVIQEAVRAVKVDRSIGRYIVELSDATRQHPLLKLGCSPRGALTLYRLTQSLAFVSGRDYAIPEDVKTTALVALPHRLALETKAKYSGVLKSDVVGEVLDTVPVGV